MPPLFSSDFFNHLFKNGGVVYVFIAKKWNAKKYMLSLVSVLQKSWRVTSVGERGGEGGVESGEGRSLLLAGQFFCMPYMKDLSKCPYSKKPLLPWKIPGCRPEISAYETTFPKNERISILTTWLYGSNFLTFNGATKS